MHPNRIDSPTRLAPPACLRHHILALLAAASVASCGGGGAGGVDAQGAAAAPASTALSSFSPAAAVPTNFRTPLTLPPAFLQQMADRLPPHAGPVYLRVWAASPGSGDPEVLFLGRWKPGQAVPPVQAQAAMTVMQIELYHAQGAVHESWSL